MARIVRVGSGGAHPVERNYASVTFGDGHPQNVKHPSQLTNDEQTAILAERYSQRAHAYDELWSPIIRPVGERLVGHLSLGATRSILDVGTGAYSTQPPLPPKA
ncbi:MAG TPA: hypothetical protein VGS16_01670 [Candidatus Dormibacteraeota bacterium]|nr:hypothetical protein [Candidatus Dormibacteraeota bacterium]